MRTFCPFFRFAFLLFGLRMPPEANPRGLRFESLSYERNKTGITH